MAPKARVTQNESFARPKPQLKGHARTAAMENMTMGVQTNDQETEQPSRNEFGTDITNRTFQTDISIPAVKLKFLSGFVTELLESLCFDLYRYSVPS